MIHIVGLYKCGTSWLLQMLAAHPQVLAWREFDPVRTAFDLDHRPRHLPRLALDYLRRQPQQDAWMQRMESSRPRSPEQRFQDMFLGRGWLPLMGDRAQQQAAALPTHDVDTLIDELLRLGDLGLRGDAAPPLAPDALNRTLGVQSIRRKDLKALMERVHDGAGGDAAVRAFFSMLRAQVAQETTLVTKAADQVMQLELLRRLSPGSTCLAIVRDGRDAAISAQHYEALMRKRNAPWRVGNRGDRRRALAWSLRAAKLAGHAQRGEVTVLRYEDLRGDFAGTCRLLLQHLKLDCRDEVVEAIHRATDFRVASGGRAPGQSAEHIVRRGQVQEWREALGDREASRAWRWMGAELSAFGYGREGQLTPSDLVLSPRS